MYTLTKTISSPRPDISPIIKRARTLAQDDGVINCNAFVAQLDEVVEDVMTDGWDSRSSLYLVNAVRLRGMTSAGPTNPGWTRLAERFSNKTATDVYVHYRHQVEKYGSSFKT